MKIALIQQHATRDKPANVARGLAGLEAAARAGQGTDEILYTDVDFAANERSHARELFLRHRRPELYAAWLSR